MDNLTPKRANGTPSNTISHPRPKNLSAIFSCMSNELGKFRSSAQKQNQLLSVSQESTYMLVPPPPKKNTFAEIFSPVSSQRQTNTGVGQSASNADSPIAERPCGNILSPNLYQSSEEAKKQKEYRKKFYHRSPHAHRKKKHPPHAKSQAYRVYRTTSTRTSSQEKPSHDVQSAPT